MKGDGERPPCGMSTRERAKQRRNEYGEGRRKGDSDIPTRSRATLPSSSSLPPAASLLRRLQFFHLRLLHLRPPATITTTTTTILLPPSASLPLSPPTPPPGLDSLARYARRASYEADTSPRRLKFSYRHVYRSSLCPEQVKCTATGVVARA